MQHLLDVLAEEYRETLSELRTGADGVASLAALAGEGQALESGGTAVTTIGLHHATLPEPEGADLVDGESSTRAGTGRAGASNRGRTA